MRITRPATVIAIVLFALIALLQLIRFLMGWEVIVNGATVPLWGSALAALIAATVAALLWREQRT